MSQHAKDLTIMPQAMIRAQQLTQNIELAGKTQGIFQDLNIEIFAGQQVAITGRSGSGKSTLLAILASLDQASSGQLWLCHQAIHDLNEEQRAKVRLKNVGFVFQSFQLLAHLSAVDNVMLPLRIQPHFNYSQARQKALDLLEKVGLAAQAQQRAKVLSGGERQRVAIARALVAEPKIIFADEPTGNLDASTAAEIEALLFRLNREFGTTLVLVTHDTALAAQCQRHLQLIDGQLVEQVSLG